MQKKGIWEENDAYIPKAGDILFYDWQDSGKGDNTGWPDHVGIVESVENGHITVIEGNLNNTVGRREIAVNARYIRGYGVPEYEEEQPEADTETPQKSLDEVAKEVINGKYGNGAERKQRIPAETPYSYEEVQARVNAILRKRAGRECSGGRILSAIHREYKQHCGCVKSDSSGFELCASKRNSRSERHFGLQWNGETKYKAA